MSPQVISTLVSIVILLYFIVAAGVIATSLVSIAKSLRRIAEKKD
jgi:hypothetical protein